MNNQISLLEQKLNECNVKYKFQYYDSNVKDAVAASDQIGIPYQDMIKSIVLKSKDNEFILCLLSSQDKVNMSKLKKLTNKKFSMATPEEIKEKTGHLVGMVTPLLLKEKMKIYVDKSVFYKEFIGLGTGKRGVEIIMNPSELDKIINYISEDIL